MAENKKGILIYADWIEKFESLSDDEAGRLIKHFFRYVNDKNPEYPDRITEIAFIDIKNTLKRDLKKWEKRAENSRENGKKGGRPVNPKEPTETHQVISEPKKPVSVNGSVTVTVNENVIVKNNIEERKLKFADSLKPFLEKYGRDMLNDFYAHWTENNKSGTKFRQEGEKHWSLEKRLNTWSQNELKFKKKDGDKKPANTGRVNNHNGFGNW